MAICDGMQRPGAGAAHQEGVAELRLAAVRIGEIAERAVERLDAGGGAGIDHLGGGVVPEVLLEFRPRASPALRVGQHGVVGMAAADARGLHAARGGEVGGAEAHAVHARRGGGDRLDIVDALRGFQDGVDQDRLLDRVPGFELRQQLVEIVDVPGAFDLGQHDDVELVADRADDLGDVVERPGRIERIDPRPQAGRAEVGGLGHGDEARARRLLGVGRDGVLEIAEHHVDLPDQLRHLGGDLFDMRRHEMDHALEPDRQFAQRRGRADRERLKERARQLHARPLAHASQMPVCRLEESKRRAKLCAKFAPGFLAGIARNRPDDRRPQSGAALFRLDLPRLRLRADHAHPDPGPGLDGLLHHLHGAAGAVLPHPRQDAVRAAQQRAVHRHRHARHVPGAGAVARHRLR